MHPTMNPATAKPMKTAAKPAHTACPGKFANGIAARPSTPGLASRSAALMLQLRREAACKKHRST